LLTVPRELGLSVFPMQVAHDEQIVERAKYLFLLCASPRV